MYHHWFVFVFVFVLLSSSVSCTKNHYYQDDPFCWQYDKQISTKKQCEEHQCFYDPYLRRCFLSLEHVKMHYDCNYWSGNLTLSGFSNEEACVFHWCQPGLNANDRSFECREPIVMTSPVDEGFALVSGPVVRVSIASPDVFYDSVPKILSLTDEIYFFPYDNDKIYINYDAIDFCSSPACDVGFRHRCKIRINNFTCSIQEVYDALGAGMYMVRIRFTVRSVALKPMVVSAFKRALSTHGRTPPEYSFYSMYAGFRFYVAQITDPIKEKQKQQEALEQAIQEITQRHKDADIKKAELVWNRFKDDFIQDIKDVCEFLLMFVLYVIVVFLIMFGIVKLIVNISASTHNDHHNEQQKQEPILHDEVDDDNDDDGDVHFHTRNRMTNGELLELDSSSSDDDDDHHNN